MSELIKVFVGTAANGEDAESQSVLEYSLRKHASQPVDIVWMKLSTNPESFWYSDGKGNGINTTLWATPFSGLRWMIPAYCNYEGKAIYMDSDMIILDDIAKLWNQKFQPGKVVMAKGNGDGQSWRYCVALWDCKAAEQHLLGINRLKALDTAHQRMMSFFSQNQQIVQPFVGNWNCIDGEGLPIDQIQCLHYSDMGTQFHHKYAAERLSKDGAKHWFDGQIRKHPRTDLQGLFDRYYTESQKEYPVSKYLPNKREYDNYTKESQSGYVKGNAYT